jgi:TolB protein
MSYKKILLLISLTFLLLSPIQTRPQVTIRPTAGEEIILAVADAQPASQEHAGELAESLKTFNQVLWNDLKFAGYFTLAGKSFYPPQPIVNPEDINYDSWSQLPFRISFMSAGSVDVVGGVLRAELRLFDMKQRTMTFGQRISGDTDQVRAMAHRWADEIVYRLTAGASRGIASTKIAFVSRHGNGKEIHVMDYDGYDDRAFTRNSSLNLMPSWAPDGSKLAFLSYRTGKPEVNIYSYLDGSRLPFPMFNTLAMAPAISPEGTEVVFAMRTSKGDTDLFVTKLDGSDRRDITNHSAIDTSPTWSPSGKQIAFTSDRIGGVNQIFICDADGANVRSIIKEGGDADSPAWSPDGKYVAFHWKPRYGTSYDLFLVEVSSGRINQLTSESGSNESPSWAPDGRHLAFESNRNGSKQIYIMLLDRSELRMVTSKGSNTSPAWGGYQRKD